MPTILMELVKCFRLAAKTRSDTIYWAEAWNYIEAIPLHATGDNYFFEIRLSDELSEPQPRLFALPAANFQDRWDSMAFAQAALEGMAAENSLSDFSGTLLAARLEIVKSKFFCVAHHIYWASLPAAETQYARSVEDWISVLESQFLNYADDECYELLTEPSWAINQGSAKWLSQWLQYRYDHQSCPVRIRPKASGGEFDPTIEIVEVDRSIVLSAAAFTWHDYSLLEGIDPIKATQLASAAGLALLLAMQFSAYDDPPTEDPSTWGRKGGLERHRRTRALKEWALSEAARMQGPDMETARRLARSLPPQFADASDDPERLIYDAIRARRAEIRHGQRRRSE